MKKNEENQILNIAQGTIEISIDDNPKQYLIIEANSQESWKSLAITCLGLTPLSKESKKWQAALNYLAENFDSKIQWQLEDKSFMKVYLPSNSSLKQFIKRITSFLEDADLNVISFDNNPGMPFNLKSYLLKLCCLEDINLTPLKEDINKTTISSDISASERAIDYLFSKEFFTQAEKIEVNIERILLSFKDFDINSNTINEKQVLNGRKPTQWLLDLLCIGALQYNNKDSEGYSCVSSGIHALNYLSIVAKLSKGIKIDYLMTLDGKEIYPVKIGSEIGTWVDSSYYYEAKNVLDILSSDPFSGSYSWAKSDDVVTILENFLNGVKISNVEACNTIENIYVYGNYGTGYPHPYDNKQLLSIFSTLSKSCDDFDPSETSWITNKNNPRAPVAFLKSLPSYTEKTRSRKIKI